MDWTRILAYVTGTVDQELLARNEYLAAENRILKSQLNRRLKLSDAERAMLGRSVVAWAAKPLPRSRLSRGRTPSLPGTASLSPVSSMAQKLVEVRADRGLPEKSSS
jgi:hypothetical protein